MLKTIFTIGVFALLALFALKLVIGLALPLLGIAIKILIIGAVVYGVMLVVAPGTARRLRDKVNSPRTY
jgi:multisubunit Na+/H+ antiporter MnhC subunit